MTGLTVLEMIMVHQQFQQLFLLPFEADAALVTPLKGLYYDLREGTFYEGSVNL